MADTREKLIELLREVQYLGGLEEKIADHLVASDFFNELQNEAYDLGVDSALHNHFGLSWDDAAELRKEVKRLQDATRWIPVTERLPALIQCDAGTGYSEAVNVLTSGRKVLTAIWDGTDFIADAEFWEAENEEITHWTPVLLPLPELPKENDDAEKKKT